MKDCAILETVARKLDEFPSFNARGDVPGSTWTTYRRHIKLLEQIQQRCLLLKVSNVNVLESYGVRSVECQIRKA
jgi:hypothetical protein